MLPSIVDIDYTNWKGERGWRRISPVSIRWGTSSYHPQAQWLLLADDVDKGLVREFAMRDIHAWVPAVEHTLQISEELGGAAQ